MMHSTESPRDDELVGILLSPLEHVEPVLLRPTPRADARPGRRRGRVAIRLAAAAAVAAGLAFAIVNALPGHDRVAIPPVSAAVVRHARAALAQPADSILHVDMTGTQADTDGPTITWRDDSWQQNTTPYDRRELETNPDGTTVESATIDQQQELYDPATDTVYIAPLPVTAAKQAHASSQPDPASLQFRAQILALLRSGQAYVVGPTTIDGQNTIEISSADGHTLYYVAPDSYRPVELDTTGTGGGTTLLFNTYQLLPADPANLALLSLEDQHPTATIDHSLADYQAAAARLY